MADANRVESMGEIPIRLKVAICGGGISGLCLAVALARHTDISIDILDLFKKLGCFEQFERIWTKWDNVDLAIQFRRSDQREGYMSHQWEVKGGMTSFHRAHFLEALVQSLPRGRSHFNKRCISYTQSADGVELTFKDGTTANADVLFACDGVNSALRMQMYRDEMNATGDPSLEKFFEPIWSGRIVYRAIIPAERLRCVNPNHRALNTPTMYCGKNKHIFIYPVAQRTLINVGAYTSYPSAEGTSFEHSGVPGASLENLRGNYEGWESDVQDALQCLDTAPPRWPVLQLNPLPFYVHGRVALVGDAAHASTPHQGSGAGLAVEDSYLLSRLLGDPRIRSDNIQYALKAYEAARLPWTHEVIRRARLSGKNYELSGEFGECIENVIEQNKTLTQWISDLDPEDDVKSAFERLDELLA